MSKIDEFLKNLNAAETTDMAISALQLLDKADAVEACVRWAAQASMLAELEAAAEEERDNIDDDANLDDNEAVEEDDDT